MASLRSNCKKRKVGCIIVKDNRVLSTGMNGTPTGFVNCLDGGCDRCNDNTIQSGEKLDQCICIHAEDNALLEVERYKIFDSSIYCTSFPCLSCTKKILQCKIKNIYYLQTYNDDIIVNDLISKNNIYTEQINLDLSYNILQDYVVKHDHSTQKSTL
tara:strand:- start:136 stop:606 length:471 start_codon:yes stop_codon:yes gene_type:complete